MKKFFYVLMAKGHKTIGKDSKDKDIVRAGIYYSKPKHVMAKNEDVARIKIHERLTNNKWTGFRLLTNKQVINESKSLEQEMINKNRVFLLGKEFINVNNHYANKIYNFVRFLKIIENRRKTNEIRT